MDNCIIVHGVEYCRRVVEAAPGWWFYMMGSMAGYCLYGFIRSIITRNRG